MTTKTALGLLVFGLLAGPVTADAAQLIVDVKGIPSEDEEGGQYNVVRDFNIGANSHVIGVGWNVTLEAGDPSWLSEMAVGYGSSAGFSLTTEPGSGANTSGIGSYDSGGVIDLRPLGLDFFVLGDGILRLEFFETFDDVNDFPDGLWREGSLTFEYEPMTPVPLPAAAWLLLSGLGGLGLLRRRKAN